MARIFEEFFEATGYDETGWGEVVPGTCVVDEDEASSAAGSPPLWGSQCLEVSGDGAGADCYAYNIFGDGAVRFAAVDFKLSALGFDVDAQNITTAYFLNAALTASCGLVLIIRVAGVNRIRCIVHHDATAQTISDDVFTLNKLYRFELKWDDTANTWEAWLDNVSRGSGSLTGAAATTQMGTVLLGDVQNSVRTFTCRYDRVEIDDAERVFYRARKLAGDGGGLAGQHKGLAG